jgi:hypothetical protein
MSYAMSNTGKGIIGAVTLTLGAVQFASGHDLTVGFQAAAAIADQGVNRAAKADRAAATTLPAVLPAQTISIKLDGLPDTSILVRVPQAQGAGNTRPESLLSKSGNQRPAVGCDPVVSVLTDIAKQLQPGRCIT